MDYMNNNANKSLRLAFGEEELGVHGKDFRYIFSYTYQGLNSLVIDGKEWLYRAPKPTFWRATTDNDRGSRLPLRSSMWLGADMFVSCSDIQVFIDGEENKNSLAPENNIYTGHETAEKVEVIYFYQTSTVPITDVEVKYIVEVTGEIKVEVHYKGEKGLPTLPVFGLRFVVPTAAISYRYEGLSGETYPDRMAGATKGVYTVEGLPVTSYLVPQDSNVHMDTKWLEVVRNTTLSNVKEEQEDFSLKFISNGKKFAFSCLPYTAEELENAGHHEELPPARRTVISILGAVRGVGGFDSWQADVLPEYHINAEEDIHFSFSISR